MSRLIVYGSLMAKSEIVALGLQLAYAMPVIVRGFRREFSQEPSWRKKESRDRAVLNVLDCSTTNVCSSTENFNGILLSNIAEGILTQLDYRERGYNRMRVSPNAICSFQSKTCLLQESEPIFMYLGKVEKRNESLWPNAQYLDDCIIAVKEWGHEFYQSFCQTTYSHSQPLFLRYP